MFDNCEVCFFEPDWWNRQGNEKYHDKHPLKYGDRVYFLGEIPNVSGHCLVFNREAGIVDMIHTDELRKANEDEL